MFFPFLLSSLHRLLPTLHHSHNSYIHSHPFSHHRFLIPSSFTLSIILFLSFVHRTMRGKRRFTVQPSTDTLRWFQCCFRSWPTPPWETANRRHLWTWQRCMEGCRSVRMKFLNLKVYILHYKGQESSAVLSLNFSDFIMILCAYNGNISEIWR